MLTKIVAWLKGEAASVDALIKGSTKLITQLEAAAVAHATAEAKHLVDAAAAQERAVAANVESFRASTIATKLKGIFS